MKGFTMTAHAVTPATDLFERVSARPKSFRIWWEIVALWLERRRNPLSATQDLHSIVNRHYKPVSGSKSPPNPSRHLTRLKEQKLLRDFAAGGVLEPVVDKVVLVSGKVVFTPDMLERVRELDVEELLKDGIPPLASGGSIAAQPEAVQASVVEPLAQPSVETFASVAHNPCVVHSDEAKVIGPRVAAYAEAVMQAARARGYAPMSTEELGEIYSRVSTKTRDHPAITYRLERAGFLRVVSGKKKSGNAMREVVFQPYRVRSSRSRIGEEIVPPEFSGKTKVEPEPVVPPAHEVVEEQPVMPELVDPSAHERGEEPEPAPASSLDGVRAQLLEMHARVDQAEQDADELEREEAERERLINELENIKDGIVALNGSITKRRARLAALEITL